MNKETRSAIEKATQRARAILQEDYLAQLEGTYDILMSGDMAATSGAHLNILQQRQREKIVTAIKHKCVNGMNNADAVADYIRDAAFTTLNRFTALKMLEARGLVQECISHGEQSKGYREFCGLAQGTALLPNNTGYRLYIECIFDELSTEVKVLFDRRDSASILWPKRQTFETLLLLLNTPELELVWKEDETIGWVYQYFNTGDERRKMRDESHAPRNSRELAVRNQFFTPRYVVQFLTDNTLGRIWYEMQEGKTLLTEKCEYLVFQTDEQFPARKKKDPRDLRVLDPACGSGHFLLYAFELLLTIYEEAWKDPNATKSEVSGKSLREDYNNDYASFQKDVPQLVLMYNLHGVDIDPRCSQIAQLALWMRVQRAYQECKIDKAERPKTRRSNIIIAEPMPGEADLVKEFADSLRAPGLRELFLELVEAMKLAGELGLLLRLETILKGPKKLPLFTPAEGQIRSALEQFIVKVNTGGRMRHQLFVDDAAQGLGLVELAEKRYDVVLMNPPFGAGSANAKKEFEKAYPKTKNDIYAAFVERGIELLNPRSRLGAITSRTGFFLSSFQKWREDIILAKAPPVVFADLGYGVLDSAMVETAAYCLEAAV